ncbi:unnamed protein product [Closterium sp. Naga37s-1]|nr:unnamed protein product [Closterium sp. Naga37s-1]
MTLACAHPCDPSCHSPPHVPPMRHVAPCAPHAMRVRPPCVAPVWPSMWPPCGPPCGPRVPPHHTPPHGSPLCAVHLLAAAAACVPHATITPCHHHPMPPSPHATITPCHHHPMPPSPHATITPCHHHPMPPSPHASITPCHHHPMPPSPHATISLCHHHPMPPSPHATITPCHHHPMPPSPHATINPCHHHPMPPSPHATITPCHPVPTHSSPLHLIPLRSAHPNPRTRACMMHQALEGLAVVFGGVQEDPWVVNSSLTQRSFANYILRTQPARPWVHSVAYICLVNGPDSYVLFLT